VKGLAVTVTVTLTAKLTVDGRTLLAGGDLVV